MIERYRKSRSLAACIGNVALSGFKDFRFTAGKFASAKERYLFDQVSLFRRTVAASPSRIAGRGRGRAE